VLKSGISSARLFPDPAVVNYSKNKAELDVLEKQAENQSLAYLKSYLSECYDFEKNLNALKRHIDTYTKDEEKSAKQKYLHRALNLYDEFQALTQVAGKFVVQLDRILSHPKERMQEVLLQRINAANEYFLPALRKLRESLFALFREVKQNELQVKAFLQEILSLETLLFELSRQLRKAPLLSEIIAAGKEIPAEALEQCKRDPWRDEQLSELSVVRYVPQKKAAANTGEKKKPKQARGASRKHTLELYKAGKSPEEIAVERNLAPATIEGHLEFFVRQGDLPITAVMDEEKLEILLNAINLSNATHPSDVRNILSDDFSWADIRIAFAHKIRTEIQAGDSPF